MGYAAAGGESYPYAGSDNIRDVAYYASNANEHLHPVGEKRENGFDFIRHVRQRLSNGVQPG